LFNVEVGIKAVILPKAMRLKNSRMLPRISKMAVSLPGAPISLTITEP
jgi:hypothetical protein